MTKAHSIRVSTRVRITIPADLRNSLGLKGGETARWPINPAGEIEASFERLTDQP